VTMPLLSIMAIPSFAVSIILRYFSSLSRSFSSVFFRSVMS
jgi:hypothetical protein